MGKGMYTRRAIWIGLLLGIGLLTGCADGGGKSTAGNRESGEPEPADPCSGQDFIKVNGGITCDGADGSTLLVLAQHRTGLSHAFVVAIDFVAGPFTGQYLDLAWPDAPDGPGYSNGVGQFSCNMAPLGGLAPCDFGLPVQCCLAAQGSFRIFSVGQGPGGRITGAFSIVLQNNAEGTGVASGNFDIRRGEDQPN